jgi:hypothetical protein
MLTIAWQNSFQETSFGVYSSEAVKTRARKTCSHLSGTKNFSGVSLVVGLSAVGSVGAMSEASGS